MQCIKRITPLWQGLEYTECIAFGDIPDLEICH